MLWIGHPRLRMKSLDEQYIQLRETDDYDEAKDLEPVTLQRALLQAAIDEAESELAHFQQRISPMVKEPAPHKYETVSNLLIYGSK
ncbi:MAG: hypothetical protein GFH27_549301n270 [Chloroflexi bacterium AL-W]|nr:hypothetical protein [Chloroflexi bacterium AL-N1]NOK68464.1 hypothetical protein [Chloroflexi bacterium AL-N10]NOK74110.1 hypothetical protein [Chloroflexi bacterium AL-N5]NOK83077.1 hypothetical protein [Chloroflexi bacterium AL-W]NOK90600.1 hypothetical protein [Chloroflexi bacterium AL-N15]